MYVAIAILIVLTVVSWLRVVRPGTPADMGGVVLVYPMPLLARIRMHAAPSIVSLLIGVVLWLVWGASWIWLALAVISTLVLLALPMKYTLTSAGIRRGWSNFRRWTEFAGVRRAPGGARLVGGHKLRAMHIWMSGSRGDDEFVLYLKQMIQDAYKGNATVVAYPSRASSPDSGLDRSGGIAAFTSER